VTDPVVDSIFLIISYLVLPFFARTLYASLDAALWTFSGVVPGGAFEELVRFVKLTVSLPVLLLRVFADHIAVGEYHKPSLG
jgi:hypothetical protein